MMSDVLSTIVGVVVAILVIVVLVQLSGGGGSPQQDFQDEFIETWNTTQSVLRSRGYEITGFEQSQGRISFEKSLSPTETSEMIDADVPADRIREAQVKGKAILRPIEGGGTRVKLQITEILATQEPAPPDLEASSFFSFLAEYIADPEQYRELQEVTHSSNGTAEREIMDLLSDRLTQRSSSSIFRNTILVQAKDSA